MMSKIFVSYRRQDSVGHAGRLYDFLVNRYGEDRIFMDLAAIAPGEDFVLAIERVLRDMGYNLSLHRTTYGRW